MATIFFDADADLSVLSDIALGIIGYGNQGRAHALNLRDSGVDVWVGARQGGRSFHQAQQDGFTPKSPEEVAANCQMIALLLPDESLPDVYVRSIEPYLEPDTAFVFAHGFAVHHKTIRLPDSADVLLVAPTGPGRRLRTLYTEGLGLPALVAVEQDGSGQGWLKCLAYARAIGCTRAGAIRTTFVEETVTDLFCEQAVLCGGMPELIKASFETLVRKGYQPELAYISCLKEVKLIADLLFEIGIDGMRSAISNTAKFGSAISGPQLIDNSVRHTLDKVLANIESGAFAEMLLADAKEGNPVIEDLLQSEKHSELARVGRELKEKIRF